MTKPNIVFILIDDMGWKDLSCYGSSFYETPNIDSLARDGLSFTDAYAACPVCSPTRASILTGKYPATVGVTNFIGGANHPTAGRLVEVPYFRELPRTEKTLARALAERGYDAWHVGKWHLGGFASYPDKQGFHVNIGGCEWGLPKQGYFSPFGNPVLEEPAEDGTYLTDYLTDKAVELIRNRRGSDRPFYLNMWYHSVHTPIQAKEEKIAKYRQKAERLGLTERDPFVKGGRFPCEHKKDKHIQRRTFQSDPVYAAMIESLDENIGKILATLRETGEWENTIVVFTSDNGGLATAEGSPTCNTPLSEGKGWMYEGGTREPLIMTWPAMIKPGTETPEPVTSPDFYPTLLEAAGIAPIPEQHVDGYSFLPLLRGEEWSRPAPLMWHYPHYGNQGGTPGCSIRDGDYKLIEFFEDGHEELYNLRDDIGEERNLIEEMPGKAAAMRERLHSWQESIMARIPSPNPDYEPWNDREPCAHFPLQYEEGTGPEV
jgi:arylsulfatase A-like enzyme